LIGSGIDCGRARTDADLRQLEAYKLSFGAAYQAVLRVLRQRSLSVNSRPEKSTLSIVAKLNREKTRLSRMQDIAGCRLVVADIVAQNQEIEALKKDFPTADIIDRRAAPKHGYRAVHLVVHIENKAVEIQVRTALQQLWAELSEKSSDVFGTEVKYGGGPSNWKTLLTYMSQAIANHEISELDRDRRVKERQEATAALEACDKAIGEWLDGTHPGREEPPYTIDDREQFQERLNTLEREARPLDEDLPSLRKAIVNATGALLSWLERQAKGES
jgi:putative GTP pyrophosphokinase